MIFETKRLYARPWHPSDINSAVQLWGDPDVTQFIDVLDRLSPEAVEKKLTEQIQLQQRYGVQYWALVLKETDAIIGCCGLRPYDVENNIYELGFHIIRDNWGNGYASEAALGAIDYAFETLHVHDLFAGHHPNNKASKHLLKKIGFLYVRDEYYPATGLNHPSYLLKNPMMNSEKIREVKLSKYDSNWVDSFEKESAKIKEILGKNCVQVYHIGSTSIPEIYAKPVIDIVPVVTDLSAVDACNNDFENIGYLPMGEYGISGRRFYWKSRVERTHHIHLFEKGNSEIERHLAFRNYLLQHKEVAQAYSQIKQDLVSQFKTDIISYVDGKGSFIKYVDYMAGHPKKDQLTAKDNVILKNYNPNWKKIAAAEMSSIKNLVRLPFSKIQYLGSTSVSGMLSEPIVDLVISLDSICQAKNWIEPLGHLGYVLQSENPDTMYLRFIKGMPPFGVGRTHHIYIMEKGKECDRYVEFCDLLNASLEYQQLYRQLKQQLVAQYEGDREAYTHGKIEFITKVLAGSI